MERSAYVHLLNPELNLACRAITGCLKLTNVENLYLLAEIAPPEIKRSVCARVERTKQIERETHSLFGVWAHTSKKTSKVEKKLPYKCSTSSLPSKSCPSQRMEEKTGEEGCSKRQAYKRWSCHSGFKLLCKLCRTSPSQAMGARFTVVLGMPAMRTRWMAGAAAHKSG